MKYACMEACRGEYPVRMMARLLAVSPSGYYEWRGRPPSARAASAHRLTAEMRRIHQESDGTYGSPRMRTELQARGHDVGRHRVARLMRQARLRGSIKKRYRVPSGRRAVGPVAANVLNRDFRPRRPNQVWAGDITYVRTEEGVALSCRRARPLLPAGRRVVDTRADRTGPGDRRAHDGPLATAAVSGAASSLGPWQSVHERRLSTALGRPRYPLFDEWPRKLL